MTKWPAKLSCYGRRYEARDETELEALCAFLVAGDLRSANRYRVGASWPRGHRAERVGRGYMTGTPVWFRQAVKGGYGYDGHMVPAVFVRRASALRWLISLQLKSGETKDVFVNPKNVSHRE